MKHFTLTLGIAATALLSLATLSLAADEKKPEGRRPGGPGGPGGHFGPEERLKHMTEALNLTQDQQDKLKAIFAKGADQMKAIREKGRDNVTEEDKTKMREFMKSQMEEIAAVLTPEQKEKWKAKMAERRPGGPERPGGPDGNRVPGNRPDGPKGDRKPEAK